MRPALPLTRVAVLTVALSSLSPLAYAGGFPGGPAACAQEQRTTQREFTVSARKYAFQPASIEVDQDDLVKITLQSDDIAHSFTIDAYRIARRVGPGQTTMFEFRADKPGVFPFYCNLAADDGCRKMRGELVVRAR